MPTAKTTKTPSKPKTTASKASPKKTSSGKTTKPKSRKGRMTHFIITIDDMAVSIGFYKYVLGFESGFQSSHYAELRRTLQRRP